MFFGRNDAKAETPVLWPPHAKGWLIGKESDAGRDWGQEEKGITEDEMAGWHHRLDGREFEWTPGVGDEQGGLACCNSWYRKESDTTERLNWTELNRFGTLGFLICGITEAFSKGNHTWNHDLWISLRWEERVHWGIPFVEGHQRPTEILRGQFEGLWPGPLHSYQKWLTCMRLTPCPYDTNTWQKSLLWLSNSSVKLVRVRCLFHYCENMPLQRINNLPGIFKPELEKPSNSPGLVLCLTVNFFACFTIVSPFFGLPLQYVGS